MNQAPRWETFRRAGWASAAAAALLATAAGAAAAPATAVPSPVGPLGYLWLLGAIGCQVGMVLAYRAASRPENNRHTVLVGAYLISSAVSLGLGFFEFGAGYAFDTFAPTWGTLLMAIGIGGGVLLVFSAELYLRSTAHGPMSITWTIRQTETMPATVVSFFLHPAAEFTPLRLIGVVLLAPTLAMFGWDKRVQERRKAAATSAPTAATPPAGREAAPGMASPEAAKASPAPVPWIALTIGSMLLLGTYRTGTLWVTKETKTPFMLYQYMTCTLVAFGFVLAQRHRMRWGELQGGMILGILSSLNLYFTLSAMGAVGPVMTFAALAVGVPTTVTLVGIKLYGEHLHWRSTVGLLLALTALLLTVKWHTL